MFANTLPLLVLGTAAFYGFPRAAALALGMIWIGSGLGVWLTGRESYHIGASGLTHGLMFFTFTMGLLRRDRLSMALAMVVFFLYGGMVWGIFPRQPNISFEYHFWGAVVGLACAFVVYRLDPLPPPRRYGWEEDTEASGSGDDEW
ncbi:MAG: rhomboid family intramembrane serine protease [Gammaproteobacteria bacterium]|nr:rhomboid family intramembrane serine protease [Gammaproteobacteria bacterium]NIR85244.1 rhomboid family intramembrane serine protease [Gammaproteobacteria bacterium]NIR88347.1 rhomboid family intramembrane serine protease [Gammaproteobacteria bacterium]NIU06309.1 rhomboid family intramembrane serine protease [Gammaproteobacteria bacterium]NIX87582.1 rhomboid family intramembrane serine protease [Gammaproteobacteria bacterium]